MKRYLISADNKANYLGPEGFLFEQLVIWPSLEKQLIIMTIFKVLPFFYGLANKGHHLVIQVNGKVTCVLLLDSGPVCKLTLG